MKNLFLVRHAKAETMKEYDSDFSRPLIKKGLKDAKKMAEKIKERFKGNALFISSPSNRAFETAHIFAGKLNYPTVKILLKDTIYYDPSPEQLLELIKEIDDAYDTIMLFGHNPYLSQFASFLIKDFEFDIPKCGVAAFAFDKQSWKEIELQSGILKFAEYPEKSSKDVNSFEQSLIIKISEAISEALKDINPDAASNVLKSIAKHSAKLACNFTGSLKSKKADKKPCHKSDDKTEHNKAEKIGKTDHESKASADWEIDEKTSIQTNSTIDKNTDWGIDEPSTDQ
ncbi:MAG: histidine phosphatase family protein [Desulfamplus sp.]